jgi:membrane protein DedA with SNARE-associated domain
VTWLDDVLASIGSFFGGINDFVNHALMWLLATVQSVDPVLRTLIAAVGMFCETSILIGLLIPGDTIVIVASTAVSSPAEYIALLLAVIAGSLAGESLGFALGRWFGHGIRHSRLGRRIGEVNWMRAERYVRRRGGPAVFVSRFLPVLHSLVPLTAGATDMSYRRFISWTAPACALWATLYVTFGTLAAGSVRQLAGQIHFIGYLFVGAVVVFLVAVIVIRKLVERHQARHWDDDDDVPAAAPGSRAAGAGAEPDER